jgi:hypothetical protein
MSQDVGIEGRLRYNARDMFYVEGVASTSARDSREAK